MPKRIAVQIMGVWVLFVILVTMTWQVVPALAGFTPTPITPSATPITATATPITSTPSATPITSTPPTGFTPTAQPTATASATATATMTATASATATATTTATAGATATATTTAIAGATATATTTVIPAGTATATTTVIASTSTTQPLETAENTPGMPVTGGQISDSNNNGLDVILLLGIMILLLVAIGLVNRRLPRIKTKL